MSELSVQPSQGVTSTNFWQGELVRLRAIEPEDAELFFTMNLNSETARVLDFVWPPSSIASVREWTQKTATQEPKDDVVYCVIEDRQGNAVGMISTHGTNRRVGNFAYGLSVSEEHRGRGYATAAILLLLRYYFEELRYQKATVNVYECNPASIALHEKIGFQQEGRVRRVVFTGGKYYDEFIFGLTREEFAERYGK